MDDAPEITVLQLPKFKAEATELIGANGIDALEQSTWLTSPTQAT